MLEKRGKNTQSYDLLLEIILDNTDLADDFKQDHINLHLNKTLEKLGDKLAIKTQKYLENRNFNVDSVNITNLTFKVFHDLCDIICGSDEETIDGDFDYNETLSKIPTSTLLDHLFERDDINMSIQSSSNENKEVYTVVVDL